MARWICAAATVTLVLLAGPQTASASDATARQWLKRMFEVLEKQNYEGRFFFVGSGSSNEVRIIHRVEKGKVTERLVFLDDGREVISNDREIVTYVPRIRTAFVGERTGRPLLAPLSRDDGQFESNYDVELAGSSKALSRPTQVILVKPRDGLRYGYKIWLDQETAMPLKWQLHDPQGRVVEQVLFAEVHFRDRIPAEACKPAVASEGFSWMRQYARRPDVPDQSSAWSVTRSPVVGFRLVRRRTRVMPGQGTSSVVQFVFSDGLASVSLFIAPSVQQSQLELRPGLRRVGAAFVYSRHLDGHEVTAVSTDVPPETLQRIAEGVMEPPSKSSASSNRP